MKSQKQRDIQPIGCIATGFVEIICFDMGFNYFRRSVEQTCIFPDAPDDNWQSETCRLIPHVRYEYIRVSKENPETSRSPMTTINLARKNVKRFVKDAGERRAVLRIVKETIITRLEPNVEKIFEVTEHYLEESYGNLSSDPIASKRKTREIPPNVKKKVEAASKKREAASKKRDSKAKVRRIK